MVQSAFEEQPGGEPCCVVEVADWFDVGQQLLSRQPSHCFVVRCDQALITEGFELLVQRVRGGGISGGQVGFFPASVLLFKFEASFSCCLLGAHDGFSFLFEVTA